MTAPASAEPRTPANPAARQRRCVRRRHLTPPLLLAFPSLARELLLRVAMWSAPVAALSAVLGAVLGAGSGLPSPFLAGFVAGALLLVLTPLPDRFLALAWRNGSWRLLGRHQGGARRITTFRFAQAVGAQVGIGDRRSHQALVSALRTREALEGYTLGAHYRWYLNETESRALLNHPRADRGTRGALPAAVLRLPDFDVASALPDVPDALHPALVELGRHTLTLDDAVRVLAPLTGTPQRALAAAHLTTLDSPGGGFALRAEPLREQHVAHLTVLTGKVAALTEEGYLVLCSLLEQAGGVSAAELLEVAAAIGTSHAGTLRTGAPTPEQAAD